MRNMAALGMAMIAASAQGAGFEDIARLESRVASALGAGVGMPGGAAAPIDRRLRLLSCPDDVLIDPPVGGAVAVRCQAVGWRIRVPLMRDTAAPATTIVARAPAGQRAAAVIRRGDPVELRATTTGFTVSTQVVAQEDGAPGQRIRVKSEGKPGPMIVEVVDFGLVRVPGLK